MEKQKNNKGVITLLIVIIVILSTLFVLFITGIISFNSNVKDNNNSEINNTNTEDDNNKEWVNYLKSKNPVLKRSTWNSEKEECEFNSVSISSNDMLDIIDRLSNNKITKYYYGDIPPAGTICFDRFKLEYDNNTISLEPGGYVWINDTILSNKIDLDVDNTVYADKDNSEAGYVYKFDINFATILNNYNDITGNNESAINNSDNDAAQETCDKSYSMMYSDKYIYKIKVINKNGANVYDNYVKSEQKVVETIGVGKELGVVADNIDILSFYASTKKEKYDRFDEIKNYYYFAIDVCGEPKYIKYSDVEIIESSIVTSQKFDKTLKFYIHSDEPLYSGPGLSFEKNGKNEIISKGTILDVNVYSRIGNALWLYINNNNYTGWILKEIFNSVNYPYNNMKYGSAVELTEEKGEVYIENDENFYKYAFSVDNIISKISKGTKVSYDYVTNEPGITYYHINYNGTSGWIRQILE